MRSSSSSSLLLLLLEKEQEAATAVARRRRNEHHPNYATMTTMTTERDDVDLELDEEEDFHDEGINEHHTNEDTTHESDAAEDDAATASTTVPSQLPPQPHPPSPCSTYAATCLIILFWYGVSNATILVTKWLFTTHFPYPLTVTCYSNSLATVWAIVVSRLCCSKEHRLPLLPSYAIFKGYVLPIGILTGFEIGCSNVALQLLTVSFGTILKGAVPIFTFGWGVLLGLEHFSYPIGTTLLIIAVGIGIASIGELSLLQGNWSRLDSLGFGLQLISSTLSGLRWVLTNKLLLTHSHNNSSGSSPRSRTGNGRDGGRSTTDYNAVQRTSITTNRTSLPHNTAEDARSAEADGGVGAGDVGAASTTTTTTSTPTPTISTSTTSITGIRTTKQKPLSPLAAILYTSPMTGLCVLPFAIFFEGKQVLQFIFFPNTTDTTDNNDTINNTTDTTTMMLNATSSSSSVWNETEATSVEFDSSTTSTSNTTMTGLVVVGTMTFIATLVFVLLMSEYWLVQRTSSLTLSVAGVVKELLTIGGGLFFFHELIDALNIIGFVVCQIGIIAYVCLRTAATTTTTATYTPVIEEEGIGIGSSNSSASSVATTADDYDDNEETTSTHQQENMLV